MHEESLGMTGVLAYRAHSITWLIAARKPLQKAEARQMVAASATRLYEKERLAPSWALDGRLSVTSHRA
jgi:hypothetical protein